MSKHTTGQALGVESLVSGASVMKHLKSLVDAGEHRRSGTAEGERAFQFIVEKLKAAGLKPQIETFPFSYFDLRKVGVKIGERNIAAFPLFYSGTTRSRGTTSEVVFVDAAQPENFDGLNIRGKIVLAGLKNDLGNKPANLAAAYRAASVGGAVGMIIYLEDWLDDSLLAFNSEEYPGEMKMPAVFVARRDGRSMRDAVLKEKTSVTLTLNATVKSARLKNIVAVLRGQSDETVIINSPYNSWFKSAVERSGTAGAIHLAEVFSSLPIEKRPRTLVFSFTSGHEHGFLGVKDFLKKREKDLLPRTKLFMNLGAGLAAKKFIVENGKLIATTSIEGRAAVCSNHSNLIESVELALKQERIGYELFTNLRIGESREAHKYDIPNFALFSLNPYFHSQLDDIDKTDAEIIEPAIRAYARLAVQ